MVRAPLVGVFVVAIGVIGALSACTVVGLTPLSCNASADCAPGDHCDVARHTCARGADTIVDGGNDAHDAGFGDAGESDGGFDAGADAGAGVVDAGSFGDAGCAGAAFEAACDDRIACTQGDRCLANAVCAGIPSATLGSCGACDADCATTTAPCCSHAGVTCSGARACVDDCTGDCTSQCSAGAVCEVESSNGTTNTLSCDASTCRADLGSDSVASLSCTGQSVCDVHIHDMDSSNTQCTSSSCTLSYQGGGNSNAVACSGGFCGVDVVGVGGVQLTCDAASCDVTASTTLVSLACSNGAQCHVEATNTTCSIVCNDTSVCTFNGTNPCAATGTSCDCSN